MADRFHFVRYIYWVLVRVRRLIQSSWHDYDRKKVRRGVMYSTKHPTN
ncbi:transposase [Jeotgalibacillus marinus]